VSDNHERGPRLPPRWFIRWADPEPAWWCEIDRQLDLDALAARRSSPTAVVILEPRPASP